MNISKAIAMRKRARKALAKVVKRFGIGEKVEPQTFTYSKPERAAESCKEIALLCKSPTMRGAVHVVRKGGEEWLHSHSSVDGFWMVLSGRIRFRGDSDTVFGEFGPMEGIMTPRNTRYYFECMGDGDAELLQVLHFDRGKGFDRHNHEPPKFDRKTGIGFFDLRT